MSERSRILRGGARAVTGLVVVAAAAAAVVLLGNTSLPGVTSEPEAIVVDTTHQSSRTLVCPGAFGVLGADPDRPGATIPIGAPGVAVTGKAPASSQLTRSEGGEGLPAVFTAPISEPLSAGQVQALQTENLRGIAGGGCAEPVNEQWLLGGGSSLGVATTLSLGNPGTVPATVVISVFDEHGPVDGLQMSSVLVPAGAEQTVSVNGYAPDRERLAVRIESTGAPVTGHLGVGHSLGIEPFAVSGVTGQVAPGTHLVIPGLGNESDHAHGPSDAGEGDEFPVLLRALAPGETGGTVHARAVDAAGKSTDLGVLELVPNAIGELSIAVWPEGANALIVESDVPVIASALGSATRKQQHDYEWFTPAPEFAADTEVAASIVAGGELILANAGERAAKVEIVAASGKGKPRSLTVDPGAAVVAPAPADALVTSSEPLHGGVRVLQGGDIAGYPVLAPNPRDGELTVYTR